MITQKVEFGVENGLIQCLMADVEEVFSEKDKAESDNWTVLC